MTQIKLDGFKSLFPILNLQQLESHWSRLHSGDREPFPDDPDLRLAWLSFHNGDFLLSAELASAKAGGKSLQLKSLSTVAHYLELDPDKKSRSFLEVVSLAEKALILETDNKSNIYYQLAYSLGRYGQFISVARALAEGLAGKISHALKQCIELEPLHADAHTALATYQAEIINKLGKIAARLTYSASSESSLSLYKQAIALAPYSVSAKTEYADGLLMMFGQKRRKEAISLYQQSIVHQPIDALEALDAMLANHELNDAD